jgi:class 3 adenylate cyclase
MSTRPKAILFTDMEGSTAFQSARGDVVAVALMNVHESAVRDAAREHDGWVVKSTGDGYLVVFPSSAEGIAGALDIKSRLLAHNDAHPDSALRVRMGLHSGTVIEQNQSDTVQSTMSASNAGGVTAVTADLTNAYVANRGLVQSWTRSLLLSDDVLQVTDACTVATGVRPVFQLHVPAEVTLNTVNMAMELERLSFALSNRE